MIPHLTEHLLEASDEESTMVADSVCLTVTRWFNLVSHSLLASKRYIWCKVWWDEKFKRRCFRVDSPKRCALGSTPLLKCQDQPRLPPSYNGCTFLPHRFELEWPSVTSLVFFLVYSWVFTGMPIQSAHKACLRWSMATAGLCEPGVQSWGPLEWSLQESPPGLGNLINHLILTVHGTHFSACRHSNIFSPRPAWWWKKRKPQDPAMLGYTRWLESRQPL